MGWKKKLLIGVGSIFLILIALGLLLPSEQTTKTGSITSTSSQQQSSITASAESMLPTRVEIETEYTMGKPNSVRPVDNSITGLQEAYQLQTTKTEGTLGVIGVDYYVYKFSAQEDAAAYYDKLVDEIVQEGGYSAIGLSGKCFGYKQDYGFQAKVGEGICNDRNVVFIARVVTADTFRSPDGFMKDGIKLLDNKIN